MLTGHLQKFVDEVIEELKKTPGIEDFLKKKYGKKVEDLEDFSMTDLLNIQDELDLRPYKMEAK